MRRKTHHVGMTKRRPARKGSASHAVGARLRAFREEGTDISQEAATAAINRETGAPVLATYRRWEITGKITAPDLLVISEILGCDPCWVLTGVGSPLADGEADADLTRRLRDRVAELLDGISEMEAGLEQAEGEGRRPPTAEAGRLRA